MQRTVTFGRVSKAAIAILLASGLTACGSGSNIFSSEKPLGYYGTGYERRDTPGLPRTHVQIYRRLLEDGYELRGDIKQAGAVYFANVNTVRDHKQRCLILNIFSGTILQSFTIGRSGWVAEIRDAPGPGFPGYPPVPDGRYALLCDAILPALTSGELVIPGLGPEVLTTRY